MAPVTLSDEEARGLLADLLEGVDALEWGEQVSDTWSGRMRLWIEMILDRMEFGS